MDEYIMWNKGERVEYIETRQIGPNEPTQKGIIPIGTKATVEGDWGDGSVDIVLDETFYTPSSHAYKSITEARGKLKVIE